MEIKDYVKIEEMKALFTGQLVKLGLKDRLEGVLDDDLNKLIVLMNALNKRLGERESEEEQIRLLVNYILGLWGILLIDYGHDISEL